VNESPSQKREWVLTQEAFDKLLLCLDPDRERAGEKYETVRHKLIKFFEWQGCSFPEDYTDKTINRVAKKIDEGEEIHNPYRYIHGVARRVFMEYLREWEKERAALDHWPPVQTSLEDASESERLQCLEQCLQDLPPESRELITQYHQGDKRVRIENRGKLAARLKIPLNALRIRVHRLREKLEACVEDCLKHSLMS